jgi:broad specificity phosphatase PhoE
MKMTSWYFLRHAEKEFGGHFNPRLRHRDEPLTTRGQQQAQQLITYFADKAIAAIYVSGYQRTWQTAEPLAQHFQLTPIVDERLNEIDNGPLEGMSEAEIQQTYPEVWQAFTTRRGDFQFPEGESGADVQRRIAAFLDEKLAQHNADNIVIVSHDGYIRLLMCYILGLPVQQRWNFRIDFAGIVEVTYQPAYAAWKLIRFNQTGW